MRRYIIYSTCLLTMCCSQTNAEDTTNNSLTDNPTPPGEVGQVVGDLQENRSTISVSAAIKGDPMISIMNNASGIITVWAIARNNWLWGYSPFDSKTFGNLRNWYILKNANGSVSFRNVRTNTCISAYKTGIIHTGCNPNSLSQQFDLLPLTNGAVALKNAANQECLRIPMKRSIVYMPITFTKCLSGEQTTIDQQWFIIPPILDSYPIPSSK
ncbi:hypothetical protein ACLS0F_06405 [Avibacterium endocarditidis]|uniref:Cytolethal distending toxin subunit A n=1 Tax=Avibacterium endocarditidis TaxID=380674 RepID=A0ABX4ZSG9_9PAST|nr:hypothetical protein [Avibacterium endocarditidis]POY42461.1 hypothetical protein C3Z13_05255 [Avibacterium endocarditidis]